jgi:UDP-glucose 4-epimerase
MKILITGGSGFIARNLIKHLTEFDVTVTTRKQLDLLDKRSVDLFFTDKEFDVVIHTAIEGGNRLINDRPNVVYDNLTMFFNLMYHKHKFNKLINFGSGAELDRSEHITNSDSDINNKFPLEPYGMSKNIIARITKDTPGCYNLRIFAVFGEDELDRRFIKNNIKNYINKRPIIISQDKTMSFIYIEDLITIIKYYITDDKLNKEYNCVYNITYTLSQIAEIINNLSNYKVPIKIIETGEGLSYIGLINSNFEIKTEIGLEEGIKKIYNKLR